MIGENTMQCPCGFERRPATHEVVTLKTAKEWHPYVVESDLPVKVDRDVCHGCGRQHAVIISANGKIVGRRG